MKTQVKVMLFFHQKSTEIHTLMGINNSSFLGENLQIGDSEELFLCNTRILPMMAGTKGLPNKGSASCIVLEMLGMGRDHERQGASQRNHDVRMMQKVNLSGWTRGEQQEFVVWVELSRQESGWPWPTVVVFLRGGAHLERSAQSSSRGCREGGRLAQAV